MSKSLDQKVDEILNLLRGHMGQKGIVQELYDVKQDLADTKKEIAARYNRVVGGIAVINVLFMVYQALVK